MQSIDANEAEGDRTGEDAFRVVKEVMKVFATLVFLLTHPILSETIIKTNTRRILVSNRVALAIACFSFAYIYTDSIVSSVVIAISFITIRHLLVKAT